MNSENELIQKLMMSKKIMDIHSKTPRNQTSGMNINMPVVRNFQLHKRLIIYLKTF
jgi:hypothetical protein